MTAPSCIDRANFLHELAWAAPDLLPSDAHGLHRHAHVGEADAVCGADYGQRSTPESTSPMATAPGSSTPGWEWRCRGCGRLLLPVWLLERIGGRRGADHCGRLLVGCCVSTRRMEKLVESLSIPR